MRFLTVFIIFSLFILKINLFFNNKPNKPLWIIAVDDSQSMAVTGVDTLVSGIFLEQLDQTLKKEATSASVHYVYLSGKTPSVYTTPSFSYPATDLAGFLQWIEDTYAQQPVAGVCLYSDGVYNQGENPERVYAFPLHVIAHGDTLQRSDAIVTEVLHNTTVYGKNTTSLVALIEAHALMGVRIDIELYQNGKMITTRSITVPSHHYTDRLSFTVEPSSARTASVRYTVKIKTTSPEITLKNNTQEALIRVVDDKKPVLIYAAVPHPDIKALKAALSQDESFEIETCIYSLNQRPRRTSYGLVIFHQLPTHLFSLSPYPLKSTGGLFYMVTPSTNVARLPIQIPSSSFAQGTPVYQTAFKGFSVDISDQAVINQYPPLSILSGVSSLSPGLSAAIVTGSRSSLVLGFYTNGYRKTGILLGEGIWKWRLAEYRQTGSTSTFDRFIYQCMSYLMTDSTHDRFRVEPVKSVFAAHEPVRLEVAIGEKITDQTWTLEVMGPRGKNTIYTYAHLASNVDLGILESGEYIYKAYTNQGVHHEKVVGKWLVASSLAEFLETRSDFNMLRRLAATNRGMFFTSSSIHSIKDMIRSSEGKPVSYQPIEEAVFLIEWRWLFFILLFLISLEWIIRRWYGYR